MWTGITTAVFHFSGTLPVVRLKLKIRVRQGAISFAVVQRSLASRQSGDVLLLVSILERIAVTCSTVVTKSVRWYVLRGDRISGGVP